jgi:hypothetical protein
MGLLSPKQWPNLSRIGWGFVFFFAVGTLGQSGLCASLNKGKYNFYTAGAYDERARMLYVFNADVRLGKSKGGNYTLIHYKIAAP